METSFSEIRGGKVVQHAGTTILYVEDNEEIAFLMKAILEREGFEICHYLNGSDAVAHVHSMAPSSIVILDIMIPYLDGFQLIREIRAQDSWAAVPILMVSAKSREQDIVQALELGANDYVTKPFRPPELLARIKRLLGTSQPS